MSNDFARRIKSMRLAEDPPAYSSSSTNDPLASSAATWLQVAPGGESSADLVVGIDFGTTFTGFAFGHSGLTVETLADMKRVAGKIAIVRTWPNAVSDKIPTVLAYNSTPPSWGANIGPRDKPRVAHFKLGLQENVGTYYKQRASAKGTTSLLGGYLDDPNWKHPNMPNKKAVDYTADYLTQAFNYVKNEALPRTFDAEFLKGQKISYVLTVPAIWTDKAKELTRQAAVRAGISRRELMLITEPEAAALYCATWCQEVQLQEGDKFLICDAGGGTVDLISYQVKSIVPFAIEECSVGTGAACGAVYLDQAFEMLLRSKFGDKADSILTDRRRDDLIKHFDTEIKKKFNPLGQKCAAEWEIQVAGVTDDPDIGIEDGYLMITKVELAAVFDPIFNQILELVKNQMDVVQGMTREKMKVIFMVGGLGSNVYLAKFLESRLGTVVSIKQPEDGYGAIMRGAVLYKLGLDIVKARDMRLSYGVDMSPAFRSGYHPTSRKYRAIDGWDRCRGVMDWYATKGEKIENGTVIEHDFISLQKPEDFRGFGPLNWKVHLWVCDSETPPEYDGDSSIKSHADMTVNLRDLPDSAWKKDNGGAGEYYWASYQIGLAFSQAGIEFKFLHNKRVIGSVDCDYE